MHHQGFGLPYGSGGLRREHLATRARMFNDLSVRDHGVNQTSIQSASRVKLLAQHQHLCRADVSDTLCQKQAGTSLRRQSQIGKRQAKARACAGINQITMQQDRGTHPDRHTLDGCDERLLQIGEPIDKAKCR